MAVSRSARSRLPGRSGETSSTVEELPVPLRSRPSAVRKISEPPKNCVSKRNRSKLTSSAERYRSSSSDLVVGRVDQRRFDRAAQVELHLAALVARQVLLPRRVLDVRGARQLVPHLEPFLRSTHFHVAVGDRVVGRHRLDVGVVRVEHPRTRIDVDPVARRSGAGDLGLGLDQAVGVGDRPAADRTCGCSRRRRGRLPTRAAASGGVGSVAGSAVMRRASRASGRGECIDGSDDFGDQRATRGREAPELAAAIGGVRLRLDEAAGAQVARRRR